MKKDENKENFPEHIAIILDGNRRWAKSRNLPVRAGHKAGAETLKKVLKHAMNIGIKDVTIYAFSTENWNRSQEEVSDLMKLLGDYLDEADDYNQKHTDRDVKKEKLRLFGDISPLSDELKTKINRNLERTKDFTDCFCVNICFNYGGRAEIVKATKEIAELVKSGEVNVEDINESLIEEHLYSRGIKDPDLLIRTSGEMRTSGFLLWQLAYTEFIFVDKNWPDFNEKDLDKCIKEYQRRNRKFGV